MENKFLTNMKSLLKSFISNKELFKRRTYSIIIPLIFLIMTCATLCLPSYFSSKQIKMETISKNFPSVEKAMEELLTSGLKCKVNNATLVCDEDSISINKVIPTDPENNIKYTIIANQKSIALDTTVDQNKYKETDNMIIFLNSYIRIRYVIRDYVNPVEINEILGDYSRFEGLDFEQLCIELLENNDTKEEKVNKFILDTYKSTLETQLFITSVSSFISFMLLVLVSCLMLKGQYLFKRKKGFKFSDCLKISLTTTLPALIISLLVSLLSSVDFATVFGLLFVGRIVFIYLKYIFPKNNIFIKLYEETKDERFNLQ